ncbi:hypothetical protein NE237_024446 [Protea cynaroides]|uniref:Uncharacterized protein n=1 Tax=Protea cynaroides TaxID=273540 RepID=A0A9Q0HDQ8_9MAGN|nr:hypothetical protein NE237_024446 [Protea cynaroides]
MAGKDDGEMDNPHDQLPVPPTKRTYTTWSSWITGSIFPTLLQFWQEKWQNWSALEGEVEVAADDVEEAAEFVEKVANVVEKVSEQVANNTLGDGPLKEAALFVDHVSQEVVAGALIVEGIIHTAEKLKEEVETLSDPLGPEGKHAVGHN